MNIHLIDGNSVTNREVTDFLVDMGDFDIHSFTDCHQYTAYVCGLTDVAQLPGVVIIDWDMTELGRNDIISRIVRCVPSAHLILFTSQTNVEAAFTIFKQGVADFIFKDETGFDKLRASLLHIHERWKHDNRLNLIDVGDSAWCSNSPVLAGRSALIRSVVKLVAKAGEYVGTRVSLLGEEGTGKATIARMIHFNSIRKDKPFVAVNLDAVPAELHGDAFFGVEKEGSSYSVGFRQGYIEQAAGGTLFVEEVGLLDKKMQQKLLQVITTGLYRRSKGMVDLPFQCRIIVSSTIPLESEVEEGRFCKELFYELRGIPVTLPTLKQRSEDIAPIAHIFLSRFNDENPGMVKQFSNSALHKLSSYSYPGNIPELRAVVELACILSSSEIIEGEHIIYSSSYYDNEASAPECEEMTLKQHSEKIIWQCLQKYDNNVMKVAEVLDIGKSTIYNLLKKRV